MTPEIDADVVFWAGVSPSEDRAKVAAAVSHLAGNPAPVEPKGGRTVRLTFRGTRSLTFQRDQLRDGRIRAAARRLLLRSMDGEEATLLLNRQAAIAKVIALCSSPGESPLGPVYLTLRSRKLQELVDWLTEFQPD